MVEAFLWLADTDGWWLKSWKGRKVVNDWGRGGDSEKRSWVGAYYWGKGLDTCLYGKVVKRGRGVVEGGLRWV